MRDSRDRSTAAARAVELRSAARSVAYGARVEGLAGPGEAYVVLGCLGMTSQATQDGARAVAAWLVDAQEARRLTVREGPFVGEPEAAVAVVADALTRALAAGAEVQAQLERAQIAAADIGALPPRSPGIRQGSRRW
ncbi:hypothetical protein [Nocardioides dokdonensis]|nr:hypothetical protein [Nocardioides dokdonensis]